MTRPLLSICIPTFNRAGYLRECLTSLETQGCEGLFEVVVSDNASDDDTLLVLEEFSYELPLRWIVQDHNIGADRNFDAVVGFAEGEYCWLLGSDDVVVPDALKRLLTDLSSIGSDIYHFGYIQTDIALNQLHRACPPCGLVKSNLTARAEYFAYMPNMSMLFTFMSAYVFRRSIWITRRAKILNWVGSHYIQTFAMHLAMAEGATLASTNECLVLARGGNTNEINTVPGKFLALDAKTLSRLIQEVYLGDQNMWKAFCHPFHRSYPLKALIYITAYGGLFHIKNSNSELIKLGYSSAFLSLLKLLSSLHLNTPLRLTINLYKNATKLIKRLTLI